MFVELTPILPILSCAQVSQAGGDDKLLRLDDLQSTRNGASTGLICVWFSPRRVCALVLLALLQVGLRGRRELSIFPCGTSTPTTDSCGPSGKVLYAKVYQRRFWWVMGALDPGHIKHHSLATVAKGAKGFNRGKI